MAGNTVPITAQVLTWTREEAGLTQVELAERARLTVESIQAWEAAESRPTKGQFNNLVRVLKRPSAVFFLPEPPIEAGMPTSLRSAPGLGSHKLGPQEARQIRWARRLQELTSWVLRDEGSPEANLPQYRPSQDPVEIAAVERSRSGVSTTGQLAWRSASEAFRSWRENLEEQGVLVMQLTMGKNNIRGFGAWGCLRAPGCRQHCLPPDRSHIHPLSRGRPPPDARRRRLPELCVSRSTRSVRREVVRAIRGGLSSSRGRSAEGG